MAFVRTVTTEFSGWWFANPFVFTYITDGSPIDAHIGGMSDLS